ncbi:SAM-dependent methyltransferase [Streptomyces misionensis]|uniref:SAM-dependent methyltransferase n=1 Tax=Streptomyces misionensis TaxID=67331 RepID=UPI00343F6399
MTTQQASHWSHTPSVARIHDYLDGGTDCYNADRRVGDALLSVAPWLGASVRVNRAHWPRVLACLTREYSIDQVVDLGCGLPHDDHRHLPDAVRRIVYVDNDPRVESHARMMLAERGGTSSLQADLRDMPALLAAEKIQQLDHGRAIGVLLHDVLPWLDDSAARVVLTTLSDWLPSGSVVSLTHTHIAWNSRSEGQIIRLIDVYERAGIPFYPRTKQQIRALLDSWTLLDDLVPTAEWRCSSPYPLRDHYSHAYATLTRKHR